MVSEIIQAAKAFENFGIAALIVVCIYKLADKWAPQFLAAQQATSTAMVQLAESVRASAEEQRETLMAVRVLSRGMEDIVGYMRDMDDLRPVLREWATRAKLREMAGEKGA